MGEEDVIGRTVRNRYLIQMQSFRLPLILQKVSALRATLEATQ